MLPTLREIELPLLEVLVGIGGQGKPRDIYPLVTRQFPHLSDEDLGETLPSGGNRWVHRIRWARNRLVLKAELYGPRRGVWAITEKGRARVVTGSSVPLLMCGSCGVALLLKDKVPFKIEIHRIKGLVSYEKSLLLDAHICPRCGRVELYALDEDARRYLTTKKCPQCNRDVLTDATQCPSCGQPLTA